MNRIILIGNGFDLAHGLQTRYTDFINSYWKDFAQKYPESKSSVPYEDELVKLEYTNGPKSGLDAWGHATYEGNPQAIAFLHFVEKIVNINSYYDLKQLIADTNNRSNLKINLLFKSDFFEKINRNLAEQKWVDIENEYYRIVKDIHRRQSDPNITHEQSTTLKSELIKLNVDLKIVEIKLSDYLKEQCDVLAKDVVNEHIKYFVGGPLDPGCISNSGQELFWDAILSDIWNMPNGINQEEMDVILNNPAIRSYEKTEKEMIHDMIKYRFSKGEFDDYIFPKRTLFLNFNYTGTARLYIPEEDEDIETNRFYGELGDDFEITHIHGELDNDKNPIIFGYGDEMDEHYKKIADLNDNEYLHNIKSIRYLETDNYRRLLTFIDSAPYQIYIMGHSCGNSDRTLLNTLFEHENCVSIKPFYYQWEKKDDRGNTMTNDKGEPVLEDDYIDIVQNISRNFRNPTLMRDRVVNKTYCEPLPQNPLMTAK